MAGHRKADLQYGIDLSGASVFVSGGTGSLGQAITKRFLVTTMPKRLLIYSRDELKQAEMARWAQHPNIRMLLGDVRDRDRLYRALDGVDVVCHAAALKQVPALEYSPREGILTNVVGSMNLVDACIDRGVQKVLAISSDKATAPLNLYGASKLAMERLIVASNAYSGGHSTRFACTRWGNVIGSRGSVVPLWREQAKTGRITITSPAMTRYWISLDQAVDFLLASLDRMNGQEVFIPRLPSVRIADVAQAVAPDAEVDVIGVRPGEKAHESLASEHEMREQHDGYWVLGRGEVGPAISSDTNDWWLTPDEIRDTLTLLK